MKITNKDASTQFQLRAYARRTFERYQAMGKREKGKFLDQIQRDFGGHRKAIVRLFAALAGRRVARRHAAITGPVEGSVLRLNKPRGRRPVYQGDAVAWWLQTLWIAMNQPSEKLMHAMLPHWLAKKGADPQLEEGTKQKILSMSPSTIERLIRSYKKENRKRIFCTTTPPRGKELMIRIPTRPQNFAAPSCGFLEGDTVAHCGGTLAGTFAWTFNVVDHVSLWTEQEAFLSNTAEHVVDATIRIRTRLPFRLQSFHSDGGSEFINALLYQYLQNPQDNVLQTHGRAYKKNDQARVEQRNWTHVRQLFGYDRISQPYLVNLMNDIYRNEWRLLNNFFTATRKQIDKVRIGAKFKRSFDRPRTPYHRVLEDKNISQLEKDKLNAIYRQLNPFDLKKSLDKKLRHFLEALKQQNVPADPSAKKEAA
jgi:hypothetical protein